MNDNQHKRRTLSLLYYFGSEAFYWDICRNCQYQLLLDSHLIHCMTVIQLHFEIVNWMMKIQ